MKTNATNHDAQGLQSYFEIGGGGGGGGWLVTQSGGLKALFLSSSL